MNTKLPSHDEVTRRATELWNEKGQPSGRDMDIWLEAERQLAASGPSGSHLNVETESATLAERVEEETAAEGAVEYLMTPTPSKADAIKAAVRIENAKPEKKSDRRAQPGSTRARSKSRS